MIIPEPDPTIGYMVGWLGKQEGRVHTAKAFIPMNSTNMAIVTHCGQRTADFVLASDYHRRQGDCLTCKKVVSTA